ncbi:hypothetical protein RQM47_12445 [Rubrivirga sp. S365]|uniref:GNAT family N-acetyltransferase n=1 Tax=Rubrivirga litoralis TaxID=3075598 RepID=A0ABU3BUE9_9BACT|nr:MULTISPECIES: hypothetical protein [unclassified Rubrivirga]MDT0632905.1 hypothetical protein [Rubrivirga sp. F394]MDT7857454.1 hypothetical protein [Rubrivirga sp. S365]
MSQTSPLPDVRLRVLQVADGDEVYADALRTMMWDAYAEAGRPLGASEDAMWLWWSYGQATTVQ